MLRHLQTYYVLNGYRDGAELVHAQDDGHYVHVEGREPLGPFVTAMECEDAKDDYSGPWTFALPTDLDQHPRSLEGGQLLEGDENSVEITRADDGDELVAKLLGSYENFVLRASSCGQGGRSGAEVLARMAQLAMSAWDA